MQVLQEVVYVSRAVEPQTAAALRRIVDTARMLNRRRDLTGVLAFSGSHFLQVLEGNEARLDELLRSLRRDARHDGLAVLSRKAVAHRRFGDWAMALVSGPELGARFESLASAAGAASTRADLTQLVDSLARHAGRCVDGAHSKFAPF